MCCAAIPPPPLSKFMRCGKFGGFAGSGHPEQGGYGKALIQQGTSRLSLRPGSMMVLTPQVGHSVGGRGAVRGGPELAGVEVAPSAIPPVRVAQVEPPL
jgi:hypothetical protein